MKYTQELKKFLTAFEDYEKQVLQPTHDDIEQILNGWKKPEYWRKYTTSPGVASASPIRMALTRIKHPDKVVD